MAERDFPVAARDRQALGKLGTLEPIGPRGEDKAVLVTHFEENEDEITIDRKSIWVAPECTEYRSIWTDVFGTVDGDTHIDHLYPKGNALALKELSEVIASKDKRHLFYYDFVRLYPVIGAINSSIATMEKAFQNHKMEEISRLSEAIKTGAQEAHAYAEGVLPLRGADPFQRMKVQGIKLGSYKSGYPAIHRVTYPY